MPVPGSGTSSRTREFESLPFEGKEEGRETATLAGFFGMLMEEDFWHWAEIDFSRTQSGYTAEIRGLMQRDAETAVEVKWSFWRAAT